MNEKTMKALNPKGTYVFNIPSYGTVVTRERYRAAFRELELLRGRDEFSMREPAYTGLSYHGEYYIVQ